MSSYFTSVFLILFLPAVVVAYAIAPKRARWLVLLLASYAFVWSISQWLIVFLLATTAITFGTGLALNGLLERRDAQLEQAPSSKRAVRQACKHRMKLVLAAGIIVDFGILVTLKYLGFFGGITSSLFNLLGIQATLIAPKIGITIGISFYTLMAVSYLIDVYRETTKADTNLGRIALFLSFFPHIMEGPICRYSQTAERLWTGQNVTRDNLYYGMLRIAIGFAKKFIIADRLNLFVKPVFDNYAGYDGGIIALAAVLYTVQLYCDFSGCMDVAIGTARIFNVSLPENFRQPFFSKTASEFWQRWHITLGTWFKDYVYYPVSLSNPVKKLTSRARKRFGNRYGPLLTSSIALFCVWLGNGLWHGAGSQYLFFGMYYFALILAGGFVEPNAQALASRFHINRESIPYQAFRIARTLVIIFIGEMFFRASSFHDGIAMFQKLATSFSLDSLASSAVVGVGMDIYDFAIVAIFAAIVLICDILAERGANVVDATANRNAPVRWTACILLVFSVIVFGAYGYGYAPVDPMYAQY
jgi:alginate O-acetyltransferase complex protein AlgI